MKNCSFLRNRCVDTGYCWGYDARPNKEVAAPLLAYAMENANRRMGCNLCGFDAYNGCSKVKGRQPWQ